MHELTLNGLNAAWSPGGRAHSNGAGFVIKEAREAQVHVCAVCAIAKKVTDMAKVLLLTPRRCLKERLVRREFVWSLQGGANAGWLGSRD